MITNITIDRLLPHQNNPRRELGDITELSDSIKAQGVLQNLTVVPVNVDDYNKMVASKRAYKGDYTIVIGHRRAAAAKLAGLAEVPCVITLMDEKTQVATMLLENIQRNDLTLYEQAQGFQLMLDLGENEKGIAEITGFSQSTVKRRLNLLKFEREDFEKTIERGARLEDYEKLLEIKDKDLRNKTLSTIGTNNFDWEIKRAFEKEITDGFRAKLISELKKFAEEISEEETKNMKFVSAYYNSQIKSKLKDFNPPKDAETVSYYFYKDDYNNIMVYRKKTSEEFTEDEKKTAENERKRENKEKIDEYKAQLETLRKTAFMLRFEFIKNFNPGKKNIETLIPAAVDAILKENYNYNIFESLLGKKELEHKDFFYSKIRDITKLSPEKIFFFALYSGLDNENNCYFDWFHKYSENIFLDEIYELLCGLGYQMSDDEKALQDGTHELFKKLEGLS
jgi:ParB family chromosome partitioning protein